MATRIRKGAKVHLYIKERMDALGLSDEQVAGRCGVARETIWRWYSQQHRLNPAKTALLAEAIGCEPADFYHPPDRPSVDSILRNEPKDVVERVLEVVRAMVRKAG